MCNDSYCWRPFEIKPKAHFSKKFIPKGVTCVSHGKRIQLSGTQVTHSYNNAVKYSS